jgi:hypothetical protein
VGESGKEGDWTLFQILPFFIIWYVVKFTFLENRENWKIGKLYLFWKIGKSWKKNKSSFKKCLTFWKLHGIIMIVEVGLTHTLGGDLWAI